jgi:DNA-binding NarL/FixJ family response regulator
MSGTVAVMVCDDRGLVRDALANFVRGLDGVELVAQACDGNEAVALAAEKRPDVIVMDVSMPGIDGVEATRRILHNAPTTRIVIPTGHADEDRAQEALRAGAVSYVLKVRDPQEIFDTIAAATQTTW